MNLKQIVLAAGLSLPAMAVGCVNNNNETGTAPITSPEVKILTDEIFEAEVLDSKLPVIIDFNTRYCPYCAASRPDFQDASVTYAGQLRFAEYECFTGELCEDLGVINVPCYTLFKDGEEINRYVGALYADDLNIFIESSLGITAPEQADEAPKAE